MADFVWCLADDQPVVAPFNQLTIFAAAVAWAVLWCQVVVIPFYNKGESLYKDYWATGKINAVLAAIESDNLIPAIARMFVRTLNQQPDKRRKLEEAEVCELLQSVEFLPDLKIIQSVISTMDGIVDGYKCLKRSASRLWKTGLLHAVLTPVLPAIYIFGIPFDSRATWGLVVAAALWALSLAVTVAEMTRFHSRIHRFTSDLEIEGAQ